jgi:hypothetical protein
VKPSGNLSRRRRQQGTEVIHHQKRLFITKPVGPHFSGERHVVVSSALSSPALVVRLCWVVLLVHAHCCGKPVKKPVDSVVVADPLHKFLDLSLAVRLVAQHITLGVLADAELQATNHER